VTVSRPIAVALAAAALALPATAQAKPAEEQAGGGQVPTQTQPRQDLRSPDARDATAPRPLGELPPAGQPTWPTHAVSLDAPAAAPAADTDDSSVPVIPIAAGFLGVLLAALAAGYGVRRMHRHTRIAA
jgi:hypothetical protein